MKDRINVAELLSNCPSGMELDCTMYENVSFEGLVEDTLIEFPILVYIDNDREHPMRLTKEGFWSPNPHAKCVIFPKGKTTWEGFVPPCQFKDGDILYCNANDDGEDKNMFKYIFIFDKIVDVDGTQFYYSHCHLFGNEFYDTKTNLVNDYSVRFATEEEKEKLFQAIKDNGYRWNPETNTLEKLIKPKFNVGDKIRHKTHIRQGNVVTEIKDTHYILDDELALPFISQDDYELVPDKFDITTLVPFESRVLVRDNDKEKWHPGIWGFYDDNSYNSYPYKLIGDISLYCIPYEGNERLLGTNDDCDEYFKTWK